MASMLIWAPIQKSAATKNIWLIEIKANKVCSWKFNNLPNKIAKTKVVGITPEDIGNKAIAKALNEKIIAIQTNRSFGFALISGEIAAIAVAPQIAVPEATKMIILLFILKTFPNKSPNKKIANTKIEIYGK